MCVENYFGETPDLQSQLDLAYESFKRFCKAEKIHCSQPPFKVRHVTRLFCYRNNIFSPGLFVKEGILVLDDGCMNAKNSDPNTSQGCEEARPNYVDLKGLQRQGAC